MIYKNIKIYDNLNWILFAVGMIAIAIRTKGDLLALLFAWIASLCIVNTNPVVNTNPENSIK